MSTIELLAIETTGVRDSDVVIEYSISKYDTETGYVDGVQIGRILPPKDLDWDPGAIAHHKKSGLIPDLFQGAKGPQEIPFEPCHMRIIWQRDFALKYLQEYRSIVANSEPFEPFLKLYATIVGREPTPPLRAGPKTVQMQKVLGALR